MLFSFHKYGDLKSFEATEIATAAYYKSMRNTKKTLC